MSSVKWYSEVACRVRSWLGWQQCVERGLRGAAIIAYHGVVERRADPELEHYSIDTATFRDHLRFYRTRCKIVPLSQLVTCARDGVALDARWVAITLDDALDNQVRVAADVLSEDQSPWALGVPAGLIDTGRTIWSYEARLLLLEFWKANAIHWPVDRSNTETATESWPMRTRDERRQTTMLVMQRLLNQTSHTQREVIINTWIDDVGRGAFLNALSDDVRFRLASWGSLRNIQSSGVEILSHGWKHRPQNATISAAELREEFVASRRTIASQLGVAPRGFVLPHGCCHEITERELVEAGYEFCLTSRACRLESDASLVSLPRFDAEYSLPVLRRHLCR